MIDYWEGSNKDGIPQAIKSLQDKPYIYGSHFLPHDAEAVEQGTGQTRLETAQCLWPKAQFIITPRLPVDDGIQRGKFVFARLWINETACQAWLDYLAQYWQEWDDKKGMFKPYPLHDFTSHAADVHRYMAVNEDKWSMKLSSQCHRKPMQMTRFMTSNHSYGTRFSLPSECYEAPLKKAQ